ncbi:MAG: flagellar hook-basal body complex protein, partial [Alphaproteobacteria bacterium]|nr:flagellar hook-basal body complex protein [Alphaproteobacteria bacterium]
TQQATNNSYSPGGVQFNSISEVARQGLLQSSASPTDLAISGEGMFVVNAVANPTSSDPYLFTRAGAFAPDQNGNLKNTADFYLQGWATDASGTPTATNTAVLPSLESVNVAGVSGSATATSAIRLGLNLPATGAINSTAVTNVQVFDSLGVAHDLTFTWTKSALNEWDLALKTPTGATNTTIENSSGGILAAAGRLDFASIPTDGQTVVITDGSGPALTFEFDTNSSVSGSNIAVDISSSTTTTQVASALLAAYQSSTGDTRLTQGTGADTSTLLFTQSSTGAATVINSTGAAAITQSSNSFTVPATTVSGAALTFNGNGTPSAINIATLRVNNLSSGALDSVISLDLGTVDLSDGLTQFSGAYNITFINQNGVQFGTFSGVNISDEGLVVALFDNGETLPIYQIPLVTFANFNGLTAKTGNVYVSSDSSGVPVLRVAKTGSAGAVTSGSLENSTVDLGTEFTNMILAQRAYSATTRIITTADEMLDELIRIKR